VIDLETRRLRHAAWLIFLLAVLPTVMMGLRSYRSLLVLHSAYEAGVPMTSSIRGWMTLDYIATTYHTPKGALLDRLGVESGADSEISLRALAFRAGILPRDYIARVQRAIAAMAKPEALAPAANASSWLALLRGEFLTAVLVYGYPVLGLTLLLGAIGLPLPNGIATAVAGSLAAQGRMNWLVAAVIVVVASVMGDAIGYGIGRLLGAEILARRGHWFGYSPQRRSQAQALFDQWGLLTVFITRTFVSYLSSVASLFAGIAHYHLPRFLAVAVAGRLVWAAAYLGLGAAVGTDLEAASGFLTNLSLLLLLLTVLVGSALVAVGRVPALRERRVA
jgi:membrane-associated protein